MSTLPSRARYFAAGHDDFAAVLDQLEQQFWAFPPRSEERAAGLFEVIEWCVVNARPIPVRVGHELMMARDQWESRPKEWPTFDAALGLRRRSKAHRTADLRDWQNDGLSAAAAVVRAVELRKAQHEAIDDPLFAAVGRTMSPPKTGPTVKSLYYANRDRWQTRAEIDAAARRRDPADDF